MTLIYNFMFESFNTITILSSQTAVSHCIEQVDRIFYIVSQIIDCKTTTPNQWYPGEHISREIGFLSKKKGWSHVYAKNYRFYN